jgi:phenylalanyl-tRNA synthetase beta chain
VFLPVEGEDLPDEQLRLVIALTGPRALPDWQGADSTPMDFFDLKGVLERIFEGLHISGVQYQPGAHPSFHPGKCAEIQINGQSLGVMGELHPQVVENYDFPETPVLAADLDLRALLEAVPPLFSITAVPTQPPILEDIAIVVDENVPAGEVEALIRQTGGKRVTAVRLFDVYRGEQIGAGKKSLAYSLTYQDPERTLTDKDAAKIRNKIIRRLERELGATLRG